MTRKKAKPQHRETVTTEPVNEGGFYKMLWNSMENDLGDARGERSPVNASSGSPPVIILTEEDSPCEENICDNSVVPRPIKEESLVIQPETLLTCSENPNRSENRVNFSSEANEDSVTVTPPLQDSTSLAGSINSLPTATCSTPRSTNPFIPADLAPSPNHFNGTSHSPISNSSEPLHEDIPATELLNSDENFNLENEENGDHLSVTDRNQVCDDSYELSPGENISSVNSEEIQPIPNPLTRSAAESTGEALNLLKSLLNQSISDDDDDDVDMPQCISDDAYSSNTAKALQIDRLPTPVITEEISPDCNLVSDVPAPEAMDVPIVIPSPQNKRRPRDDVFPVINNFVPSKIKLEPTLVMRSLTLLKQDLTMLYNDLISSKVLVPMAEPITHECPPSPDIETLPQSTPLPKAICCVKVERLPDPFVSNNGVVMSDRTFKTWKSQIVKQRNEEKFRHLKVWRRGRTLLWRECELTGMDRATYDEQVAFIKKHKLSESSSECDASSSDDSHDEASDRVSDCEAESSFSADEQTTSNVTSSPASSPICHAERRLPLSPRTKPGPRKGVKYKSAAAVAERSSKSGVPRQDEYVVEHTTVNDHDSAESKKVSSLKITLRKASFNKSEDEQEKTGDSEADSENSFTVPATPNLKNKRNFITKRTYRKPEEVSKEAGGPKIQRKENKYYMEDNQDNQALLGRRSDEVENFNLLEKWDIPFEAPTLFRSPRVASRLAQLKNKETFSPHRPVKKAPPKVMERVSREVRDVVDKLCTRTVEAVLCPELTSKKPQEREHVPPKEPVSPPDVASNESPSEPQPAERAKSIEPDQCSTSKPSEPVEELKIPEPPTEPIGEPSKPSEEQCQLEEEEDHPVVSPTKPSESSEPLPDPLEIEPPSSIDDTASELDDSKLESSKNVDISARARRNRRRAQGWGARKRKRRSNVVAESIEVPASGKAKDDTAKPASPASTQVPVVSEGPGQSPLGSEDDVANSRLAMDKEAGHKNYDKTNEKEVKLLKDREIVKAVKEKPETKEENLTAATQSAAEPRVTRSKQPIIDLAPKVLENVGIRKKRISGNSSPQDVTDVTKPKRQLRKSSRKSQVSTKPVDEAIEVPDSANTQVHEVSEGPGEAQGELADHKAEEVPTTRVLRRRPVTVNHLPAETKGRVAGVEAYDRKKTEREQVEPPKDEPDVPPVIPDSPMSPAPEDSSSTVENEPPQTGRITRAKKRMLREGPAFIAIKQSNSKNAAEDEDILINVDKTEHEQKETESQVPQVIERKEENEIQSVETEPKSIPERKEENEIQSVETEPKSIPVHDSETLAINLVTDQEVTAPISSQIEMEAPGTMSNDGKVLDIQESITADLNTSVEVNHILVSEPCLSPKVATMAEPRNVETDSSKDTPSDLNSSSDRLAVLDALNSIRSSIEPPKRIQKVKTPPLPTPSLPGCIDLPLESLILPDELDDDFGDIGDLVVDEEFSEDENDDSPLAVRIKKIVQDQIQNKDDDDSESIADRIKKIVQEQIEQDALSEVVSSAVSQDVEGLEKTQNEPFVDKAGDGASKAEGEKQEVVPSEEAKKDLNKVTSQENKENVDKSKDIAPKRRDSIDEKTGLPTSLIQRLRDPRIRSKLLSQLEDAENMSKEKTPVTVVPLNEQPETKPAEPVVASRDPRALRSSFNDPRRHVPTVPAVVSVPPVVVPPVPITPPTVVAVRRTLPTPAIPSVAPVVPSAAPVSEAPAPPKEPSDDEEESLKRRPKKAKKEVDAELMYKSPLEDLNSETRPSYGRAPIRRVPRRESEGRRWDARPRHVNPEMPRSYHHAWPQLKGEPVPVHPEPWKTHWFPGFPNPYQALPDPQAAIMETALVNLNLLPKTTKLTVPPIYKVFHHFNMRNPQPCRIPPPAFDPKEEARTITMCDAMGEEMIDIVQLPRPTSRLTKEFFADLPADYVLDDIIKNPYMTLSDMMDEDIEIQHNSGNFLAADDDYDEALVKWPVVQKSDGNVVVVNSAGKIKEALDDDPLKNILHQLPLLKQQYSMKSSPSSLKISPESQVITPPPPPSWTHDVDLRTPKVSPVEVKNDRDPAKDWRNPSPPKKRSKSKRRRSSSRSPRRRSVSRSPRRSSSRSRSRSATPSRRSRSRSPYFRRSRSRSSERRRRRRSSSRSPSYKRRSTSTSPPRRRRRR